MMATRTGWAIGVREAFELSESMPKRIDRLVVANTKVLIESEK
jgi:hypothetical protein